MSRRRGSATMLGVLLAGATLLRLPGLNGDLWMDEVFARVHFMSLSPGEILATFSSDNNHVLYSLLAGLALRLSWPEAIAIRLPALLFGVASLWALARLATPLIGRAQALWATALLAVSYHHVWFSQNARGYTGLLLATLLATDAMLRLESGGRSRYVWLYAAALAFGAGMHLLMGFVGLAHLLWLSGSAVARSRPLEHLRPVAIGLAGGAALTLALYAAALPELIAFFLHPSERAYTAAKEWTHPGWLIAEAVAGLSTGAIAGLLVLALAGLLALFGLVSLARTRCLAPAIFVLPGVLTLGALLLLNRHLWPRFFFHFAGFACLFLVHGAMEVGRRLRLRALGPALCGVAVVTSLATLPRIYLLPKQDYTGARDRVEESLEPGDVVVGVGLAGEVYRLYYAPHWRTARTAAELRTAGAGARRVWAVYTLPGYIAQTRPDLLTVLETDYTLVEVFPGTLARGELIVRLRDPGEENE